MHTKAEITIKLSENSFYENCDKIRDFIDELPCFFEIEGIDDYFNIISFVMIAERETAASYDCEKLRDFCIAIHDCLSYNAEIWVMSEGIEWNKGE
jgi:hypothetical protein